MYVTLALAVTLTIFSPITHPHPTFLLPHTSTHTNHPTPVFPRLSSSLPVLLLFLCRYRGLEHDPSDRLPSAFTASNAAISLSGMSKAYALPGLRVGWLASKDKALMERVRRRESDMGRDGEGERERAESGELFCSNAAFLPPPRYFPPLLPPMRLSGFQVNELKDFTTICPATYVEDT